MPVKVLMPKGSDTMTEGKVLKWLKQEGDPVSTGDALLEIETDKVNMEVEAMGSGVLRKILLEAGKVAPVGELLAVIAKPNEEISGLLKSAVPPAAPAVPPPAPAPGAVASPPPPPSPPPPATGQAAPPAGPPSTPQPPVGAGPVSQAVSGRIRRPTEQQGGRVLASPLARRMAQEIGLDLARVTGTGPGGRIVREDVERTALLFPAARAPQAAATAEAPLPAPALLRRPAPRPGGLATAPSGPEYYDEPLSSMRKVIATRLVQSKAPVPHFYLTIEVDMKRAQELRASANLLDPELKLSYNDLIVKACAAALRQHPEVNASFQGESIRYHNRVHIAVAVAVEGGLITPVIRDCDCKSLPEVSREAKDLIARGRNRKLTPDEYAGSTFSVSNLGMMGIEEFAAVINPPEGAVLAVGAVTEKPVVEDGRVGVGLRCRMTLSCDHRVVDGATGARFLQTLKQILENPVYLAF
jgi:pyruvate dehydrogenase E2 component (dihydrolipoamide acetyltransferase)